MFSYNVKHGWLWQEPVDVLCVWLTIRQQSQMSCLSQGCAPTMFMWGGRAYNFRMRNVLKILHAKNWNQFSFLRRSVEIFPQQRLTQALDEQSNWPETTISCKGTLSAPLELIVGRSRRGWGHRRWKSARVPDLVKYGWYCGDPLHGSATGMHCDKIGFRNKIRQ